MQVHRSDYRRVGLLVVSATAYPRNGSAVIVGEGGLVIVADCPSTPYCTNGAASRATTQRRGVDERIELSISK